MAKRDYQPTELVALPLGLTAANAVTLATGLQTAAKSYKSALPKLVQGALKNLATCAEVLQGDIGPQPVQTEPPAALKQADQNEDTGFSVCKRVLEQRARIPNSAHAELAARLSATLFPKGLKFITLEYRQEWAEADAILKAITAQKLEADLVSIVGADVVAFMRESHANYGAALGITAEKAAPVTAAIRDHKNELMDAIRTYVVRVSGHMDADDPASVEMTEALLRPITAWQTSHRAPADPAPSPGSATPPASPTP